MGQAPKHESRDKITELEAEKGDAKMTLVPCIMALMMIMIYWAMSILKKTRVS